MPTSRPLLAVLTALLIATAGCAGLGGTDVQSLDDDELPPGVTGDGVEDADALAAAHAETLTAEPFDAELTLDASFENAGGTENITIAQRSRMSDDGSFRFEVDEDAPGGTVTQTGWSNGTVGVTKVDRGEETRYLRFDPDGAEGHLTDERTLYAYLASGDYEPTSATESDGRTLVTLTADEYVDTGEFGVPEANVSAFEATAVVDLDGRIHSLELSMTYVDQSGTETTIDVTYDSDRRDSVTVERPDWVEDALAE